MRTLLLSLAAVAFNAMFSPSLAGESPRATCAEDGIALGGYDVVSYFAAGGPLAGRRETAVVHDGLTYLFANESNRAVFAADPQRYLPAYGGWCATTVAHGALRCPDFSNFKIEEGRLLFFEITGFTNGRAVWDSAPSTYRARADSNFVALIAK